MGILGFGRANKLEDLKIDDLRRERVVQEVEQDNALKTIRRAQQEYDRRLELASEPGVSTSERDVAAYRMKIARKTKAKAEADLQQVLTRMTVLDSAIDVIHMKRDLQKNGVWKRINQLDPETLENQLKDIAVRTKGSNNKLQVIVDILETDEADVAYDRSPEYDEARAEIDRMAREKGSW